MKIRYNVAALQRCFETIFENPPPPRHFWQDELYSIRIASNAGIFLSNSTFGLYWLLFVISFYFEFKFSKSFPLFNLRKLAGKESLNPLEFHLLSDCPLCTIFTLQTRAVTRYDIHICTVQGAWAAWHTVHGVYCAHLNKIRRIIFYATWLVMLGIGSSINGWCWSISYIRHSVSWHSEAFVNKKYDIVWLDISKHSSLR